MNKEILSGKRTYILGGLIALIGLLASTNVIPTDAAQEIIIILLGIMGITIRAAVAKLSK